MHFELFFSAATISMSSIEPLLPIISDAKLPAADLQSSNQSQEGNEDCHIIVHEPKSPFLTLRRFVGGAFLVSVAYFDPGNWSSGIAGGSRYEYSHLFIILLSSLIAILFQVLCIKLGVVTGNDLAVQNRLFFGKYSNFMFYVLAEVSIIATDLAEVIGTTIALNLLFGIPLIWGVALTSLDTLLILKWWKSGSKYQRHYELFVFILVVLVIVCFALQLFMTSPSFTGIVRGLLIPDVKLFSDPGMLFITVSIIGATVMPHNLYLHSSIVRNRRIVTQRNPVNDESQGLLGGEDAEVEIDIDSDMKDPQVTEQAERDDDTQLTIQYSIYDTIIALSLAFLVNATILIVAASAFNSQPDASDLQELPDAYRLLKEHVGKAAATAFAIALLLSGQSSSITGTIAGEIVMSGFLNLNIRPVFRRLLTRGLAILPALVTVIITGDQGFNGLLLLSQVVLSAQLPFAVFPLILFTSSRRVMDKDNSPQSIAKSFVNGWPLFTISMISALLITVLNFYLAYTEISKLFQD